MDKLIKLSQTLYTEAFVTEYSNYAIQFVHAVVWFIFSICVVGCLYYCAHVLTLVQMYLLRTHVLPEFYKVKKLVDETSKDSSTVDKEFHRIIQCALFKTIILGGSCFLALLGAVCFVCLLDETLAISVGVSCTIIVAAKVLSKLKVVY